jgi:hypothetical protein
VQPAKPLGTFVANPSGLSLFNECARAPTTAAGDLSEHKDSAISRLYQLRLSCHVLDWSRLKDRCVSSLATLKAIRVFATHRLRYSSLIELVGQFVRNDSVFLDEWVRCFKLCLLLIGW